MLNELDGGIDKLSPKERQQYAIKGNNRELARRIEAEELSGEYPLESLYYLQQKDEPLSRENIENKAVVMTQKQFEEIGYLDIILPNGEATTIFSENTGYKEDDNFIIFPEDVGSVNG